DVACSLITSVWDLPKLRQGFACRESLRLAIELFVGHLLHPVDRLAIERLGDGDMRHTRRRRCAMPVFLTRQNPDDIAGPDVLLGAALYLHPAQAGGDDQGLAQRMSVPSRAGAGLESHDRAADAGRSSALKGHVDPDSACEILRRTFRRWLRAAAHDVHGRPPKMIACWRAAMRQSRRQQCGYRAGKHSTARNVDDFRHFCAKSSFATATALTAFGHP